MDKNRIQVKVTIMWVVIPVFLKKIAVSSVGFGL